MTFSCWSAIKQLTHSPWFTWSTFVTNRRPPYLPPFPVIWFLVAYQVGRLGWTTITSDAWWLTIRSLDVRRGHWPVSSPLIIIIIVYRSFPCYAQVRRFPPIKLFQLVLSNANFFQYIYHKECCDNNSRHYVSTQQGGGAIVGNATQVTIKNTWDQIRTCVG